MSSTVFPDIGPARTPSGPGRPRRPSPGPPRSLTSVMPAGRGPLCNLCATETLPVLPTPTPGPADGQSAQPCVDVPSAAEPLGATGARLQSPGGAEGQLQASL